MKDKFNLVGTKVKEFQLSNSQGDIRNIRELEGKSNVVLVLFRSKS
ncbi:MAG: hypothetical protein ACFE85_15130 [Candidatus Hodarchaeota archaeon]